MSVCQLISELIKADDVNAGDKNLGQNVHKNIIDAFNAIVPFFEEKHVSVARQILPRMITVVGELCKWDDSVGSDALSMFSELCEIEEANLVNLEITKFMAEVSLQICLVPDYEEETRANGLAQLQMLIKYRVVLQKCHENAQKWPKMSFLTQKSPQMTFFDLKTRFLTENGLFNPKTGVLT